MTISDVNLDEIIQEIGAPSEHAPISPAGLSFNPFPVTGIANGSESSIIPPLDPAVTDRVREFLIAALRSGKFTGLTVIGDFGLGKTHLLRWIAHVVNTTNARLRDQSVRAYYVSNPGIRPMDVLMAVTKAIGEEDFRKMLWALVAEDLRERHRAGGVAGVRSALSVGDHQSLLTMTDESAHALVAGESLASLARFRERYQATFLPPRVLRDYAARVLNRVTGNLDVIQALVSMLLDDETNAFASWISLTSTEGRHQLRVPQQDYFRAILNVIKRNGVGAIFLLIDEFEDVVGMRLNNRQRAEYLSTLRLLIDDHVSDFSLVVALAPQAWELTKSIYPAFTDRVGRRVVDLRPLTAETAEELVRRYLAQARQPDDSKVADSLRPFTSEAVRTLVRLTEGNTRAFVGACYRVLHQHWLLPEIGESEVRAVVSE